MSEPQPAGELKHTPLHGQHVRLGGRMVPFAGYDMPVQYSSGIIKEHLHTRAAAGLFDVSHMGQIALRPRSGRIEDAARALETLLPADILGLPAGRQRLIGADASHAWISVYCPKMGWIDFDPTNNMIPAEQHITIAWGRDYDDISPIKGVILGGGTHTMSIAVDVAPLE